MRHHHDGPGRAIRLVLAASLAGGVLAVVPLPRLVTTAGAMETETRHVAVSSGGELGTASGEAPPGAPGADGAVAGEEGLAPFVMIGVTLPEPASADHGEASIRVRRGDRWGEWVEVHDDGDHGPDPGSAEAGAAASEPIWVGAADAYEVRVPDGVEAVEVHLVREGEARVSVAAGDAADGAPAIRSRASWGARPPTEGPFVAADLRMAVVHHSAAGEPYSAAQVPSIIRAIQAYHMDANGWWDLAYNFVVDRFGVVWEGRAGGADRSVVGGHARGFNTATTGVVLLGDFTRATPTAAAVAATGELLAWKLAVHGIDPSSTVPYTTGVGSTSHDPGTYTFPRVIAHRDVGATSCPGGNLYAALGAIRARVAARHPAHLAAQPRLVLPGDFDGDGRDDALRYRRGSSPDELWAAGPEGTFTQTARPVQGSYRPVVGDFDGDGRDDVLWHGPGSTSDSLWFGAASGYSGVGLAVGGSFLPFVGDFDGDGIDDVFWYAPGPAIDEVWYGQASRSFVRRERPVANTYLPLVADYDGDGIDDIFWYGPGAGGNDESVWYGRPDRTVDGRPVQKISGTYTPIVGDFDGDDRSDIFWYGPGTVADHLWTAGDERGDFTSAVRSVGGVYQPHALDVADDGATDILWYAPGSRPDYLWQHLPGGAVVSTPTPVSGTYDVVVGHLDDDARADVLWSAATLGTSYVWLGTAEGRFRSQRAG